MILEKDFFATAENIKYLHLFQFAAFKTQHSDLGVQYYCLNDGETTHCEFRNRDHWTKPFKAFEV
jgi:hypothetical protein